MTERVIVSAKSLESTKNRRYHRPGSECPDAPACHINRYACEWVAVDRDELPERYSACKNCDPDLDQVRACPECDSASTRRRHPSRASADRLDDCEYRCEDCRTSFDDPVWRQPYHKPSVGTSPLARKLREADPEDLGLSPEGERGESSVDRGEGVRTDGGQPGEPADASPHLDPRDGLWVPPRFREFGQGIVFRTPRGTIQHFGSQPLDPYYGLVTADDFGDKGEICDCRNPELAPNKVSIKPYGKDAEVFELEGDDE